MRFRVLFARLAGVGLTGYLATLAPRPALAEPSTADTGPSRVAPPVVAPGQAALERAQAAWDKGDFDVAEPLYTEALDTGGLAPPDVLDAYVHLGAARVVLGKKAGALTAFRTAARLDPKFVVPPEAGKRAIATAAMARRLEVKVGAPRLHTEVPTDVAANTPVVVSVTLDAAHATLPGSRLGVYAHDDGDRLVRVDSVRAAPSARFELPAELMLPSTTLRVRVDWLDAHANRLASAEDRIHVQAMLPEATQAPTAPLAHRLASVPPLALHDQASRDGDKRGFWHSAWPYVLGATALAAGGAAVYFATRSGDYVNVTGVRVLTH